MVQEEEQPPIISLPHDLIHKILLKAGEVSLRQFRRTKRACHTFRDVMEEEWYIREVDLWEMDVNDWPTQDFEDLKALSLQLQNPSAMYLRGIRYLFREGNLEEGLNMIGQAADKGYDLAIYANACLGRIIHPTDRFYFGISREFIYEVRKKLSREDRTPWDVSNLQWFLEKKELIDIGSIQKCKCLPNSGWHLPFKGPGACDECFWKGESWSFAEKMITGKMVWP